MSIATKIPGGNELINAMEVLKRVGVEQGMKVGDLGCGGAGHFTLQAAKMVGKSGIVYGVDVLKSALGSLEELAKSAGIYNIKPVWSDLEIFGATDIKNETLDIVLLINILFQATKRVAIIKEATRMLKRDGKLLIIDWKKTGAPFGPPVDMRVDPEKIKDVAIETGLKLEKEFEAGNYHYGLIFKKV